MTDLVKRTGGKVAKRTKAKSSDAPVEIKPSAPVAAPTPDFGELAQVVVTGAENQANQLATLEVQSFTDQMRRNAPVVADAKAQVASKIFGMMSDAWSESMQIEESTETEATSIEGD